MRRKLCIVTGTRAEYGLFVPLLKKLRAEASFQLQLVAAGMHLSPEFGLTYRRIEGDGFRIDRKVEMLLSSDTPIGTSKSMGLGIIGFAEAFQELEPDLVILLGDRFEILSAAQAAMIARVPIAHIAGGDLTEGAFDDAIRHSITKMAQLHFVTNEFSWKRVRQLGENPEYIFHVGSPGIDRIKSMELMGRRELEEKLRLTFRSKNLLITFHPATLEEQEPGRQFWELLTVLHELGPDVGLIFTKPNADPGSRELIRLLEDFSSSRSNVSVFPDLGDLLYLSLMSQADMVVGNSSSGVYETPSFQIPTVNIGDRQKGRLFASSVICCKPERREIEKAIGLAFEMDCTDAVNPYGLGDSAQQITAILKSIPDYKSLVKKKFFDLPAQE
ncbi:UDP-N-acetylglucosamine 2-epimerase (hydrolyzing) [Anoxybacterium hadale]|uniref:UDP-N-acetylglucosamine 2-epimerase (Hydrolyzing) n=1 Tax=Anoxybacterium hadale TaxID=3408580 RepID=A0ACD1AAU9_9FIRM|nr:UDP-N-acetylglucosamine 2-epimerase (hydrolyzing) [Clostridiales bacterium]